jgi:predicted transcriptional regulator
MDFKNLRIKGMEDRHKISILIFLLENGPSMKSRIYENISTNPRMADKIDELAEMGLVTIEQRRFENNAMFVSLTPKGTAVAKRLCEIELLISE